MKLQLYEVFIDFGGYKDGYYVLDIQNIEQQMVINFLSDADLIMKKIEINPIYFVQFYILIKHQKEQEVNFLSRLQF